MTPDPNPNSAAAIRRRWQSECDAMRAEFLHRQSEYERLLPRPADDRSHAPTPDLMTKGESDV